MNKRNLADYSNYTKITSFYLETRLLKIKNLITVFYSSEKNKFILVDSEESVISPKALFTLYRFNIYAEDTKERKEIKGALIKFHRNNTIDTLLG